MREKFKNNNRRIPRHYKIIGILLLLFVAVNFIPSNYYLLEPGPPMALQDLIEVEDNYREEGWGEFYLTAVNQRRATLWDLAVFFVLPAREDRELMPMEAAIPPEMSEMEYLNFMASLMEESQLEAQAAAYQQTGHEVTISSQGVEVVEVSEDSEAQGILQPGDIIKKIEEMKVELPSDAQEKIRQFPAGSELTLTIIREEEEKELKVLTKSFEDDPEKSSLGIYITAANLEYDMPELVRFSQSNLVGPSAGVMFALEIYNQLTPEDITTGRKIAGTGTIDHQGNIGPVDGVPLKAKSAIDLGAEVFIAPSDFTGEMEAFADIEILLGENLAELLEELDVILSSNWIYLPPENLVYSD